MQPSRTILADAVANPAVARLVDDLRGALARLHSEVHVVETSGELRAEFRGVTVCRIVPYRELVHLQIGQHPIWEARLRTPDEYPGVMDRIVRAFLQAFALSQAGVAREPTVEARKNP